MPSGKPRVVSPWGTPGSKLARLTISGRLRSCALSFGPYRAPTRTRKPSSCHTTRVSTNPASRNIFS